MYFSHLQTAVHHLCIWQLFSECLLCARLCARPQGLRLKLVPPRRAPTLLSKEHRWENPTARASWVLPDVLMQHTVGLSGGCDSAILLENNPSLHVGIFFLPQEEVKSHHSYFLAWQPWASYLNSPNLSFFGKAETINPESCENKMQ